MPRLVYATHAAGSEQALDPVGPEEGPGRELPLRGGTLTNAPTARRGAYSAAMLRPEPRGHAMNQTKLIKFAVTGFSLAMILTGCGTTGASFKADSAKRKL